MTDKKYVKLNYTFDENHQIFSVSDAYGGINSKGKLVMHLFNETQTLPEYERHEIDEDGKIIPDGDHSTHYKDTKNEDLSVDRIIHSTIFLDPNNAIEIAFWMIDMILSNKSLEIDIEKLKNNFIKMVDKEGKE